VTEDHKPEHRALTCLLDGDTQAAHAILCQLAENEGGYARLQQLAHASTRLAGLCRDAALVGIFWTDSGEFPGNSPRLGAHAERRKEQGE
jgi:hypothetical protein